MRTWTPEQISQAAGARLVSPAPTDRGPERAVLDSRQATPETLFVGLAGTRVDGGTFAAQALAKGAWGTLTTPEHAEAARCAVPGVLLAAENPLRALQSLARAWRRHLGASVIGVTGSTGKTSTKDLLEALLKPHRRTVASRANFNSEIGLPLEVLNAPEETEVLVLEMGMRGVGQIAELAQIAEPDVGVIVNIGPVHLELLGSLEAIAAAKAELIAALKPGGTAVIPAREPLLEPHHRTDISTVTFGVGGDVRLEHAEDGKLEIAAGGQTIRLEVDFHEAHLRGNLLAATAAARALGITPTGRVALTRTPGRGASTTLPSNVTLIDDCYNANPMSMRAALDELAATARRRNAARTVAVLGDMLELGAENERRFHHEIGAHAESTGVGLLVTVGPLAAATSESFRGPRHSVGSAAEAAELLPELLEPGDVVLVKGSRGVGLEIVCDALTLKDMR